MLLNDEQVDVLKELINIGVGKSIAILTQLVNSHINLSVPKLHVVTYKDLQSGSVPLTNEKLSLVNLDFQGNISGSAKVAFPIQSAANLVSLLTDDVSDSTDLDSIREGTLNEVANMLLNGVMGSMANLLNKDFEYQVPFYKEGFLINSIDTEIHENSVVIIAETHFEVKDLSINGEIVILFEVSGFANLKTALDNLMELE